MQGMQGLHDAAIIAEMLGRDLCQIIRLTWLWLMPLTLCFPQPVDDE